MAADKHIDIRLTQSQANLILIGLEDLAASCTADDHGDRRRSEIEELMDMIFDAGLDAGFGDVQT